MPSVLSIVEDGRRTKPACVVLTPAAMKSRVSISYGQFTVSPPFTEDYARPTSKGEAQRHRARPAAALGDRRVRPGAQAAGTSAHAMGARGADRRSARKAHPRSLVHRI